MVGLLPLLGVLPRLLLVGLARGTAEEHVEKHAAHGKYEEDAAENQHEKATEKG